MTAFVTRTRYPDPAAYVNAWCHAKALPDERGAEV